MAKHSRFSLSQGYTSETLPFEAQARTAAMADRHSGHFDGASGQQRTLPRKRVSLLIRNDEQKQLSAQRAAVGPSQECSEMQHRDTACAGCKKSNARS
jgi:hypothetical protein